MPEAVESDRPSASRSVVVLGLAALAVVHSVLIALWLAPSGPVRDVVGATSLARYVDPYFEQRWNAIEPSRQRVDESLQIRARVRAGGDELTTTGWTDLTQDQLDATRHDLLPARSDLAARRLATNLNGAMFAIGAPGRRAVRDNYTDTSTAPLQTALLKIGTPGVAVRSYITNDTMATRFASLYATARSDDQVVQVQYRVGRRTVPAHDKRDTKRLDDLDYEWFVAGWRRAYRGTAAARSDFESAVGGR